MSNSTPVLTGSSMAGSPSQTRINEYFLELERLLSLVEQAQTHYQALEVSSVVAQSDLSARYYQLLTQLFPPVQISEAFPTELLHRIESSFQKISQAFVVLSLPARRREYDQSLLEEKKKAHNRSSSSAVPPVIISPMKEVVSEKSRRRKERMTFITEVEVTGSEKRGDWSEMTDSIDLADNGLSLYLKHPVRVGNVLRLSFRVPAVWQTQGRSISTQNLYAIVRRTRLLNKDMRIVGLEFLGDKPPEGFAKAPWASFRTARWGGTNRRRHQRVNRNQTVFLEYQDENGQTVMLDNGITENLSARGARIRVAPIRVRFETVRVSSWDRQFHHRAEIVDRYLGKDGQERLCLYFPDDDLSL